MPYSSTKTWEHAVSIAFRQPRAESHCKYLHGYAPTIRLTFESDQLDHRNWVVDFGGLKEPLAEVKERYDHKTIVALDDPDLATFQELHRMRIIQLQTVEMVGIEGMAFDIFRIVDNWLKMQDFSHNPRLASVEVWEHPANSAIFRS